MLKVTHIITGLASDGAEQMLYNLLAHGAGRDRDDVISLTSEDGMGPAIRRLGVRVRALGLNPAAPDPRLLWRLAAWLWQSEPDVVHSWMYHANLLGGMAARVATNAPVLWAVHHANLDLAQNKRRTVWVARACARLSRRLPARIVYCSESARRLHEDVGYDAGKAEVIPNGFDLDRFRPDARARAELRAEWGIPSGAVLIGMAARLDPAKDHASFFAAAARVAGRLPHLRFALCGKGLEPGNPQVAGWVRAAGLEGWCLLLGARDDMPRVYSAFDIATSSSASEAFPMAVGEAMACALPCVVTDAGDSALLVGDAGRVAPRRDPAVLAAHWELLAADSELRRSLGEAARRRIAASFSLDLVAARYGALYRALAGPRTAHNEMEKVSESNSESVVSR
jgi:glycosyltransferase involved in cell wall biosynthesis